MFPKQKTVRDPEYLQWLRGRPCAFCGRPPPSEVSHHGRRGVALKASDHLALPSCHRCHARHHSRGSSPHPRYDSMSRDQRREAFARIAAEQRKRYLNEKGTSQ